MNNLIVIFLLSLTHFNCNAQSPIVSIDTPRTSTVDGAYFKDLNNELNKFVGTWIFSDGTNQFTLEMKKVEMVFDGTDYIDKLVGEYKFVSNGVELVNTLQNINNSNPAKHNVKSRRVIGKDDFVKCEDCTINERRIKFTFYDPERMYLSNAMILRYLLNETNPEKLTATIYSAGGVVLPTEDSPGTPRVPIGSYTIEKQ